MPVKNSINNQSIGFTVNAPTSGTALTVTGVAGSLAASFAGTSAGGISVTQANGGASSYQAVQGSVDVQPVYFNAFKNRAGGVIVANDVIYQLQASGLADVNRVAALHRIFSPNVGANFVSGAHDWWTTSTAGATNQRMVLSADGFVGINPPAAAGSALTVNGVNSAANYSLISQASVAGGIHNAARLWNYDGTAGSATQVSIDVFNQLAATGGDPSLRFLNIGIRAVTLGIDSSTDQFVIANSSALGSGNILTWTASNSQINMPLQCCFHAYVNATILNATGNNTNYQIVFNTETFDQGSNYNNATGLFTAPATGRYAFTYSLYLTGLVNHGQYFTQLVTTSLTYTLSDIQPNANILTFATNLSVTNPTIFVAMTAGDTAFVRINVNGGTNTQVVNIFGAINDPRSNFSGYLIC
jgi:hypothetical protein